MIEFANEHYILFTVMVLFFIFAVNNLIIDVTRAITGNYPPKPCEEDSDEEE